MKLWKYIVAIIILVSVWTPVCADESVADSTATESELNVQEVIFGHTGDSYEWHLTNIGDKAISIPLPVIVRSRTSGWHVFSSAKVACMALNMKDSTSREDEWENRREKRCR